MKTERHAAQYVRMSSDGQDLSLAVQEAAIAAYARAHGIAVIATYRDGGRSGLDVKHRPAMVQLLKDVAGEDCPFSTVLVYDVSRWGRFQDTDAFGYYEYHCRLHDVDVIYVKELFGLHESPMAAITKNLKRAMAAEYSRELGLKARAGQERAIDLGFQMGPLPCLGLRRTAISHSGRSRPLDPGQWKGSPAEHIKWALGPVHEIEAVRQIFQLYASTDISMEGLVKLLEREGVRDRLGRTITKTMLAALLRCEAFIGNFVWGAYDHVGGRKRQEAESGFNRRAGAIPAIVDQEIWERAQAKRRWRRGTVRSPEGRLQDVRSALGKDPAATLIELASYGCGSRKAMARRFGSVANALSLAGRDPSAARERKVERQLRGWRVAKALIADVECLFAHAGIDSRRPSRQHLLVLGERVQMRIQLMWRQRRHDGFQWWLPKHQWVCDYVLIARMREDETAQDFLLMSLAVYNASRPWGWEVLPGSVIRLCTATELVENIRQITNSKQPNL